MPGSVHEGIRLLFQNRPELARALVRSVGVAVPRGRLSEDANAFSDLSPPTYGADLVVRIGGKKSRACLIVEVQREIDQRKRFAWPRYCATAHATRRCPTWVVVVTTSRRVARWARRPVATFQPGVRFAPLVIGPDEIARITDVDAARACPELAVLSAVLHARDRRAEQSAVAAIEAARGLDTETGRLYTDLVFGSLDGLARAIVEEIMKDRGYEPLTPIVRQALRKGLAQGEAKGLAKGLRAAVEQTCRALKISWTAPRAAAVRSMNADGLEALNAHLLRKRAWPSD